MNGLGQRQLITACALFLTSGSANAAWTTLVDRSPMDDKEKLTVMALAKKDPLREKLRQITPILFITCSVGDLQIYLSAGTLLTRDAATHIPGRIRYDSAPAESLLGDLSTNSQAIFFAYAQEHFDHLLKAQRVLIEFKRFQGGTQIAEFDVAGLDRHLPLLKQHCRLPTLSK